MCLDVCHGATPGEVAHHEILQQLVWAARSRKKRVARSMAGGSATKPSRYSLEGCYVPGRFLFRVVAQEGLKLYSEPSIASLELSNPSQGGNGPIEFLSYVVAVEVAGADVVVVFFSDAGADVVVITGCDAAVVGAGWTN